MREIRFRAWFIGTKSMQDWVGISHRFAHETGYWYFDNPKIILMQYIGFKDKNGVEIYDGDICKYKDDSNTNQVGRVRYVPCQFYLEGYGGDDEGNQNIELHPDYDIEVIGNIYESKHLLDNIDTKG